MNNNSNSNNRSSNNNNNRRRGRGGNNRQNGGQPVNRIDSRARGNAPQMLEKYRKLAHDAHLNGDRVQEEYYLQFADHYFRVLADQRQRQEEQRIQRPEGVSSYRDDNRSSGYGEDSGGEYAAENDGGSYGDQSAHNSRDDQGQRDTYRDDVPQDAAPREDFAQDDVVPAENPFLRSQRQPREQRQPRRDTPRESRRDERPRSDDQRPRSDEQRPRSDEQRPRSDEQRPRSDEQRPRRAARAPQVPEQLGLDPSMLPPAISPLVLDEAGSLGADQDIAEVAPRRRGRPRKPASDAGEALEAVS